MRFLLDSNVLSEPAKPKPNEHLVERLTKYRDVVATASPVWHELLYGCRRLPPSKRRRDLERYLETLALSLPVLSYDNEAADWHAAERARLTALGRKPAFVDGQIAAVARSFDLILVTGNVRHFVEFEGLVVEDWTQAGE